MFFFFFRTEGIKEDTIMTDMSSSKNELDRVISKLQKIEASNVQQSKEDHVEEGEKCLVKVGRTVSPPEIYTKLDPQWMLGNTINEALYFYLHQCLDFSHLSQEMKTYLEEMVPSVKNQVYFDRSDAINTVNDALFKRKRQRSRLYDTEEDDVLEKLFKRYLESDGEEYSSRSIKMFTSYIFTGKTMQSIVVYCPFLSFPPPGRGINMGLGGNVLLREKYFHILLEKSLK